MPVLITAVAVAVGYLLARSRVRDWPLARTISFLLGLATLLVVKCCLLAVYDHTLFWALATQDVLLLALVPVPLVLGRPLQLLRAATGRPQRTGPQRWWLSPMVGSVVATSSLLAVYLSGWDLERLTHKGLFALTHLLLLLAGCAFLGPLLSDTQSRHHVRTLVAFLDGLLDAIPGLAVLGTHAVIAASWYGAHPRAWGPTPIKDQQLGGTAMIALSELVGLPALVAVLVQWVRADAVEAADLDARLDNLAQAETRVSSLLPSISPANEPRREPPWWEQDPGPLAERAAREGWADG
ncbi:MAG: hypothetical protein JWN31_263 [Frankiales bacterium]|nr:hypothetical protein [Frankiales bacterium]